LRVALEGVKEQKMINLHSKELCNLYSLLQYFWGDKLHKNGMGRAYKSSEMFTEFWLGKFSGRDHLQDLGADQRTILKWILKRWECESMDWIELSQERVH